MPVQHRYKPKHLALAIALALGGVELASAQLPSQVTDSPPIMEVPELPESTPYEAALQKLKDFSTHINTVPISFDSPESTFQGTTLNDFIVLKDGASFSGRLDGDGEKTTWYSTPLMAERSKTPIISMDCISCVETGH
ncbi:hypothetical protein JFT91_05500 [Pseudomonas sp. TH08]|uniref:hypothetical protein n=1 Tax=Pseudomonas sp. TH08 TaxID=2796374 RepID=UPI001912F0E0|nr:hypothetical protein [Pseudomonas sp. TH08]